MKKIPLHSLYIAARTPHGGAPLLGLITGRRRTGHAVVTITRNGRTHEYKVGLMRYRTLALAIIRMPWRMGGHGFWHAFDLYLCDLPKAFREPVQFRAGSQRHLPLHDARALTLDRPDELIDAGQEGSKRG